MANYLAMASRCIFAGKPIANSKQVVFSSDATTQDDLARDAHNALAGKDLWFVDQYALKVYEIGPVVATVLVSTDKMAQ